jgi:hypothetical protein
MALFSAHDDFVNRSLSPLSSVWERLAYVAGLRTSTGRYEHWGLTQTYGRNEAQRGMAEAHSEVFQQILATPLRELHQPFSKAVRPATREKLVPEDMKGCCREHMEYVVEALTLLSRAESPAAHQAA